MTLNEGERYRNRRKREARGKPRCYETVGTILAEVYARTDEMKEAVR